MKFILPLALMFSFAAEACFDLEKPVRIDLNQLQTAGELIYENVETSRGQGKLTLTLIDDVVVSNVETQDGKIWGPLQTVDNGKRIYKELYPLSGGTIVHTFKNVYDSVSRDFRVVEIDYPKSFVWLNKNVMSKVEISEMARVVGFNGDLIGYRVEELCVTKI